jgi:membrane fusion protein (multidrug efflux system)
LLRSVAAILIVLLLGATGAGAYWKFVMVPGQQAAAGGAVRGGPGGPVPVEAQPVRVGDAETSIEAVGTLISNESVVLRPEVNGRVTAINFVEGGMLTKGAVLVELDNSIERAELEQAEAQLSLARSNYDRAKELRRNNAGTQRALDEADMNLRTTGAAVDLAQARLDKRTLVAPFDSRAGLRNVSPGEFVTAGASLVNLEQIDPLKVDFRVPEVFLPVVAPGQRIALEIDAYPDQAFSGVVKALDPLVDKAGRAVVVRAEIANDEGKLRPGLFARVRLTVAQRQNALFVPEQAIQPQGNLAFVFKVVDQAKGQPQVAKLTPVKLGNRRKGEVEVSEGLLAGDLIVTAGLLKIRDGVPVKVQPPGGEPAAKASPPVAGPATAASRTTAG